MTHTSGENAASGFREQMTWQLRAARVLTGHAGFATPFTTITGRTPAESGTPTVIMMKDPGRGHKANSPSQSGR